jgi:SLT domain-containing protein
MADGFRIASAYVDVTIDEGKLDTAIANVEAKLEAIRDRSVGVDIDQTKLNASLGMVEVKLDALRGRALDVGINKAEFDASIAEILAMMKAIQKQFNIQVDLDGIGVAITEVMAISAGAKSAAEGFRLMRNYAAELAGVNSILGAGGGGWRQNWIQWAHWILAVSAEVASVLLPAMVAVGAAVADAAQGTQQVAQHMEAVWTAAEATSNYMHQTLGSVLGLRDELQRAQNAANPMVYQALGAAINVAKTSTLDLASVGLSVLRLFDTFLARVQYDLGHGGSDLITGLLSDMVRDAQQIGQIFATLGDAVANLAAKMPGLVHLLLDLVQAGADLIDWFAKLPSWVVTSIIVLEEFYRWGGLLITIFARIGAAISSMVLTNAIPLLSTFGEYFQTIVKTIGVAVGAVLVRIGELIGGAAKAGGAMDALAGSTVLLGTKIGEAAATMGPGLAALIAISIGALAFLIVELGSAKNAQEQFADAIEQTVNKSSNLVVLDVIAQDFAKLDTHIAAAKKQLDEFSKGLIGGGGPGTGEVQGNMIAGVDALTKAQQRLQQQFANVGAGVQYLSRTYGTTFLGALALAQAANVKLQNGITGTSQAADIARIKIADLVAGYIAMGQPVGIVGRDMTALAIDAGLQSSKVSQLNSAWDDFMTTITGGTGGLASFEQSITSLTSGANDVTNILGRTSKGVTLTASSFSSDLSSAVGNGAQAWQNFDQVIGSTAPQLIDWLRTAGAEGVLSGGQFTQAVRDMVNQLLPFAQHSAAARAELDALAQQAGGPTSDSMAALERWVNRGHDSIKGLQDIIDTATEKMGNMAQVAQNLGNVMANDIVAQMDAAKLKTYDVTSATEAYTNSLKSNGSQSSITHQKYADLVQILTDVTGNNKQANTIAQAYARSLGDDDEKTRRYTSDTNALATALHGIHSATAKVILKGIGSWKIIAGETPGGTPISPGAERRAGAAGMRVPEGFPHDTFPALLTSGEAVVPAHLVPEIAGFLKARGVPGFDSGGIVGSYVNNSGLSGAGSWVNSNASATVADMATALSQAAVTGAQSAMMPPMKGGMATPGQVIAWIMAALRDTHTSSSWLPGLELIALYESDYNPYAINLTDINAKEGDPSRGLFQTIATTFDAYHQRGTSWNIYDPVANAAAAINYIKARYGTVWNVPGVIAVNEGRPYVGYARGGYIAPGQTGIVGEAGVPEYVTAGSAGATVTPGAKKGVTVIQNFYGPQYPTPEQQAQMTMKMTMALQVAP